MLTELPAAELLTGSGERLAALATDLARAGRLRGPDLEIAAWCQSLLSALTQGETLADDVGAACIELRGLP